MANRGLITTLAAEAIVENMRGCTMVKAIHRAVQPLPVNMQRYYALEVYKELGTVWTGKCSADDLQRLMVIAYKPINWNAIPA